VTRKATSKTALSTWQQQAIASLRAIACQHSGAMTLVTATPEMRHGYATVTVRLPAGELPAAPGGLAFRGQEDFLIGIGPSWVVPPRVDVEHQRFAGHPHVLQGHRLCIYLDPAREWDPRGGMPAFLDRLWAWLGDAAAGRFDAATAMYHPVGGILHLTPGTPTLVIREPVPGKPFQHARLLTRTARRLDVTFAPAPPSALVMSVLTLSAGLPLGAGLTLPQLLTHLDTPSRAGPPGHTGLGPAPARALLTSLAASTTRNPGGTHQYFTLAVPHPAGGPAHLLAGRLPAAASDQLRQLHTTHTGAAGLEPAQISNDIPIEWCRVSDERPEVTTRRDDRRPVSAFRGRSVLVWGCGGIGSWIAEFVTRSGAAKVSVCDDATVTGGLLVRQNYTEADIGDGKAEALAARLRAISDRTEVRAVSGLLPGDLAEIAASADVVIDATVSTAVGQILAAVAVTFIVRWRGFFGVIRPVA
jgi:ThiF family protein/E2/UBC family protein A